MTVPSSAPRTPHCLLARAGAELGVQSSVTPMFGEPTAPPGGGFGLQNPAASAGAAPTQSGAGDLRARRGKCSPGVIVGPKLP